MPRSRPNKRSSKKRRTTNENEDDEITSSDSETNKSTEENEETEEQQQADSTPSALSVDEKRLLLAKEYLRKMGLSHGQGDLADVSNSLRQFDTSVNSKRFRALLISEHLELGNAMIRSLTKHRANCLDVAPGDEYVYTGGKDGKVIQWNVETGQHVTCKDEQFSNHGCFAVQSVCLGMSGRVLLSAGDGPEIKMWDTRALEKGCIGRIDRKHTGRVTCLSVQADQFYTGSEDKTFRVWSLLNKKCENVNYGHTAGVVCMDSLNTKNAVTGGQDGTIRYWHLAENSHAMYHDSDVGDGGFVDSIAIIGPNSGFLSGHETGHVKLWSINKRKVLKSACIEGTGWVSSIAAIPNSDVAFTGSSSGIVEQWRVDLYPEPTLQRVRHVKVEGHVNGMRVSPSGAFLFAATSKEERLGRWNVLKSNNLGFVIIPLEHQYIEELYPDNE